MNSKKQRALAALLTSGTIKDAAKMAKVSYSSINRWLKCDPEFKRALQEASTQLVEEAALQARNNLSPAIKTLRRISDDESSPAAVQVQAARYSIEFALRLTERVDVLDRLASLEKQMREDNEQ